MKAPADVSTILEPEKEEISFKTKSFWDVAVPSYSEIHLMEDKSKRDGGSESSSSKTVKPGHINVVAAGLILLLSVLVGFLLFALKGWGFCTGNFSPPGTHIRLVYNILYFKMIQGQIWKRKKKKRTAISLAFDALHLESTKRYSIRFKGFFRRIRFKVRKKQILHFLIMLN